MIAIADRTLGLLVIPLRHIQYSATASLRAIATLAILRPRRIKALGSTPSELVPPSPRVTCQPCQLRRPKRGLSMCLRRDERWLHRVMFFFAWAIGKALLIVMVSFGTLVYAAWAVTWPRKEVRMVESPRIVSLASTLAEKTNVHEPEMSSSRRQVQLVASFGFLLLMAVGVGCHGFFVDHVVVRITFRDEVDDRFPNQFEEARSRLLGSTAWSQSRKGSLDLTTIAERFSTSIHDLRSHAARRSLRWCKPPTCAMPMISRHRMIARGSGASFANARFVCDRRVVSRQRQDLNSVLP
jgi:hypothetical protein